MQSKIIPMTGILILASCSGSRIEFDNVADSGVKQDAPQIRQNNGGNSNGTSSNMDGGSIENDSGSSSNSGGSNGSNNNNSEIDSGKNLEPDSGNNKPDVKIDPPKMDGGMNNEDSGNNSGGSNGSNNNNCQPKNCLDIALDLTGNTEEKACGVVDNGCGNLIDCGGCAFNGVCGGGPRIDHITPTGEIIKFGDSPVDNICNTNCYFDRSKSSMCSDIFDETGISHWGFYCPKTFNDPFLNNCSQVSSSHWCCPHN